MYRAVLLEIGNRLQEAAKQGAVVSFEEIVKHLTLDELRLFAALDEDGFTPEMATAWERATKAVMKGGCTNV